MPRIGRLAPPLVLMGVIWYLSAQPDLGTDLGWIDTVLRKGAHITEFGLLFVLWLWALGGRPASRTAFAAAAIAVAWAVVDELHQSTVDGRVGAATDVLIDATGVAAAWGLTVWAARRRAATAPTASRARWP
jgi:VanZ family protein